MWQVGRSANPKYPYFKYLVFQSKLLKMDMYILKYPAGSSIDWHKDAAPKGYVHHRLNIVLKKAKEGGRFLMKCPIRFLDYEEEFSWVEKTEGRFNLFTPSVTEHAVEEIKTGTRYVLSIGWLRKEK